MTSVQIIIHEKLNTIQCFCGFVGKNHQCEKLFKEKLSFANVLLTNIQNALNKLRELNIMKKGGRQTETGI